MQGYWDFWSEIGAPLFVLISMARLLIEIARIATPPIRRRCCKIKSYIADSVNDRRARGKLLRVLRKHPSLDVREISVSGSRRIANRLGLSEQWMTDERILRVLTKLHRARKVIRIPLYKAGSWSPEEEVGWSSYKIFDGPFEETQDEENAESKCLVFSSGLFTKGECDFPDRYKVIPGKMETTEQGVTHVRDTYRRDPAAPPCNRCYDRLSPDDRSNRYRMHICNLLRIEYSAYHMRERAPIIIKACEATKCDYSLDFLKRVVEQASMLSSDISDDEMQSALESFIRSQQETTK